MSAPLTSERLAEIQARADAATPGPWQWRISRRTRDYLLQTAGWDIVMGFARWGRDSAQPEFNIDGLLHRGTDLDQPHPDAEFIAAARKDVADLLAEVSRLRANAAWDDPATLDARAYRHLADGISATMAEPNEWDGDDAEETILLRYVQHLATSLAAIDDEIAEFEAAAQGDPNTPAGVLLMIQILRRVRPAANAEG
jgi:hypothetical protein